MSDDLSPEDVAGIIDHLVSEALSAAGVEGPPVDALALARHRGINIVPERTARGAREIVLPEDRSAEARQWIVARGIAEDLREQLSERLGFLASSYHLNLFALHLLLPTAWFAAEARAMGHDVLELKKRYPTAPLEEIAFRLVDLSEPCVVTLLYEERVQRRRSNGPRVKKKLEEPERECLRQVMADAQPHIVRRGGWTVQGWPAPLDGWQRTILRSVVDVD